MIRRYNDNATLLHDAVHCWPVFAAEQFPGVPGISHRLQQLAERGVLGSSRLTAVLVSRVECLHIHMPGDNRMNWQTLAADLHRRWARSEPRPLQVYWASRRTIRLLGGCMPGKLPQLDAVSHDLGVSATSMTLFAACETFRRAWVSEELFDDVYGQAKPDGALVAADGPKCLIEFAGRYSAERLARLGALADCLGVPLQLFTIWPHDKEHVHD
jgi:hypothetical protein